MGNPFTPSFGKVPAVMAGRSMLIDELVRAYQNSSGDPNWATILVGARGTGKTAMLACMATCVEEQGWIAVRSTAIEGMLQDLYEQTLRKSAHLIDLSKGPKLTGLTLAQVGGIQFAAERQQEMNWRSKMTDVLEALESQDVGLLIEVDEVNPRLSEMEQLVTVYQHFVTENRKVALLMAGLPHRVSELLNGDSVSFLRRACRQDLGSIEDCEVAAALSETVELEGKSFEVDALDQAVAAVEGFPYMLQLVGYRSWEAARYAGTIDAEAVARGVSLARGDMVSRVLRPTLAELSNADLAFLRAMLADASYSTTGELARRLNRSASYVSTYKRRLLDQGLIEEVGRGKVRFALPLLREYAPVYLEEAL